MVPQSDNYHLNETRPYIFSFIRNPYPDFEYFCKMLFNQRLH